MNQNTTQTKAMCFNRLGGHNCYTLFAEQLYVVHDVSKLMEKIINGVLLKSKGHLLNI